MSIADIPQLQHLTTDEKLQLIEELWDSLDQEALARHEISDEEKAILDQRLADHEAHPERSLTLDEFKKQIELRVGSASPSPTSEE